MKTCACGSIRLNRILKLAHARHVGYIELSKSAASHTYTWSRALRLLSFDIGSSTRLHSDAGTDFILQTTVLTMASFIYGHHLAAINQRLSIERL